MDSLIRAERIVVKGDRLVCTVVLSTQCPRMSCPALMEKLQQNHPRLAAHACKNKRGPLFGSVMDNTALIHVLEHLAIDYQVQQSPSSDTVFVGNSQWIDKQAGTGCVELSFQSDVDALSALKQALAELNQALADSESSKCN